MAMNGLFCADVPLRNCSLTCYSASINVYFYFEKTAAKNSHQGVDPQVT